MNFFLLLGNEIVTRPIFNFLVVFLSLFGGSLGWSIIALTLLLRLLLIKNTLAQTKMQQGMTNMQPKMQEIQERYKDNPEKQAQEMMKLMKSWWGASFKGCLMLLFQLPVLIGLYYVVRRYANNDAYPLTQVYSFLQDLWGQYIDISNIDPFFFGINLLEPNNILLTVLAVVFMALNMKVMMTVRPQNPGSMMKGLPGVDMPDMSKMMKYMQYFFALALIPVVYPSAAAIGLYMTVTSLFSMTVTTIQYRPIVKAKTQALFVRKR